MSFFFCYQVSALPQITSLAFRDGLNFGVGTSTGKVLLYDLRAAKPLIVKDHMYGIPIKKVIFHSTLDQVYFIFFSIS
jgi:ribosome biogenesis protein ENP2